MSQDSNINYSKFLELYSTEYLSDIDVGTHNINLDKFLSLVNNKNTFTIFDVGSNAGSFIKTVKFKKINSTIHAFEPHPFLYNFIAEKYSDVTCNQVCLHNFDGICNIHIPSLSVGISSVINRDVFNELKRTQHIFNMECNSVKLDTYCEKQNINYIDFLKIDVEGAEYYVLEGAKRMLSQNKIFCIQLEVGIEESGFSTNQICALLSSYGYEIDRTISTDYFCYLK